LDRTTSMKGADVADDEEDATAVEEDEVEE
jgi:hypothetical protein